MVHIPDIAVIRKHNATNEAEQLSAPVSTAGCSEWIQLLIKAGTPLLAPRRYIAPGGCSLHEALIQNIWDPPHGPALAFITSTLRLDARAHPERDVKTEVRKRAEKGRKWRRERSASALFSF
jgi:hypothetical protein